MVDVLSPSPFPDGLVASSLNIFKALSYAGLILHIWEWVLGFSFEVNHIWTKPSSSMVKWQYLWSRYLGIAGQIGNIVVMSYFHPSRFVPRRFCVGWFIEQAIIFQGLLCSLEVTIIRRLYALFDSSTRLSCVLYALILGEHLASITFATLAFDRIELVEACLVLHPGFELSIVASVMVVTQSILWGLTLQSSWNRRVPLTSLMIRDGSCVFGLVTIVVSGGAANLFIPTHRPIINPFSVITSVLVSVNCRIIINLETSYHPQRGATTRTEFTTHVDTGAGDSSSYS